MPPDLSDKKRKSNFRLAIAGLSIAIVYIAQLLSTEAPHRYQFSTITKIIVIAILVGAITYLCITLAFWVLKITESSRSNTKKQETNATEISYEKLRGVCDHVAVELHTHISSSLQLLNFDSDIVDEISEDITSSWYAPCASYSYGLVVIAMMTRDASFLQSRNNNMLQHYLLNKMALNLSQSSLAYKAAEASNQELVDEVTEDLKAVVSAVRDYCRKINAGEEKPLNMLIHYLTRKIHMELETRIPDIENKSLDLLQGINADLERELNSATTT